VVEFRAIENYGWVEYVKDVGLYKSVQWLGSRVVSAGLRRRRAWVQIAAATL